MDTLKDKSEVLETPDLKSFLRAMANGLLKRRGMNDTAAQITSSLLFLGGKAKTMTIVNDLDMGSRERLNDPASIPYLKEKGVLKPTIPRYPHTYRLSSSEELKKKIIEEGFYQNRHLSPKIARNLLLAIDKLCLEKSKRLYPNSLKWERYNEGIKEVGNELPSLFMILDCCFCSLGFLRTSSIILAILVISGGIITKRSFYESFDFENYHTSTSQIRKDLEAIGFSNEKYPNLPRLIFEMYMDREEKIYSFTDQNVNLIINQTLSYYCGTSSLLKRHSTEKKSGEPSVSAELKLEVPISFIANSAYVMSRFSQKFNQEIIHQLDYTRKTVGIRDVDLYFNFLKNDFAVISRIKRELKKEIGECLITYIYNNHLSPIFAEICKEKRKRNYSIKFIINEELEKEFFNLVQNQNLKDENQSGEIFRETDTVTIIPAKHFPEFIFENSLIFVNPIESSTLNFGFKITEKNLAIANSFDELVDFQIQHFKQIVEIYNRNTYSLKDYVNRERTELSFLTDDNFMNILFHKLGENLRDYFTLLSRIKGKKIRLVLLGPDNAGKTTFLHYILTQDFDHETRPTIGAKLENGVSMAHGLIDADIFDLSGQEKYRNNLWVEFLRRSDAIIFVFDIADRKRYNEVREVFQTLRQYFKDKPCVVAANKFDLIRDQQTKNKFKNENFLLQDLENEMIKLLDLDLANPNYALYITSMKNGKGLKNIAFYLTKYFSRN